MVNFLNSSNFKLYINSIIYRGKKIKFLTYLLLSWRNLKLQKLKPTILFFLILSKLKPLFIAKKKKLKKKKK